jgi:hypothetical protein
MKLEVGKRYKAKGEKIPPVTILSIHVPYNSYASFFGAASGSPEYLGRIGNTM